MKTLKLCREYFDEIHYWKYYGSCPNCNRPDIKVYDDPMNKNVKTAECFCGQSFELEYRYNEPDREVFKKTSTRRLKNGF